ncbi:hypothetical protein D3C85_1140160 [compost metagenome]
MLVDVQVQLLRLQRRVGLDEVAEFNQLHLQAFFGGNLLHHLADLRVRADGHADLQFGVLRHGLGAGKTDQGGKNGQGMAKAHEKSLLVRMKNDPGF